MLFTERFNNDIHKIELGLHKDISSDQYHSGPGVSSSQLKYFLNKSPKTAKFKCEFPSQPTASMEVGTAVHMLTFEPHKFASNYAVCDARGNSKEFKDFEKLHPNKTILKQKEYDLISNMTDSLKNHRIVGKILEGALFESSIYWVDKDTQLLMKCRPDIITSDGVLYDLKTVVTANPFMFGSNAIKFGYDLSAAMYTDGLQSIGIIQKTMIFILVEKEAPHDVSIQFYGDADIELGKMKFRHAKQILSTCLRNNAFPGYPEEPQAIMTPPWAYNYQAGSPTYEGDDDGLVI